MTEKRIDAPAQQQRVDAKMTSSNFGTRHSALTLATCSLALGLASSAQAATYAVQALEGEEVVTSRIGAIQVESESMLSASSLPEAAVALPNDLPALFFGDFAFFPGDSGAAVQRFDRTADGGYQPGPALDLGSLGVEKVPYWRLSVVDSGLAYFFDSEHDRVLLWNPTTMTVTGEIAAPGGAKPGYTRDPLATYGRVSQGRLYVPINWYDDEGHSLATTAVYVIDTTTNEAVTFSEDTRCAGYTIGTHPSGDLYFFPDDYLVQEFFLNAVSPVSPCSLIIRAGQSEFDALATDLSELVGGSVANPIAVQGALSDGRGGFYLSAADPDRFYAGEEDYYTLYHWQAGAASATPVADAGPWQGSMIEQTTPGQDVYALQPSPIPGHTRVFNASTTPLSVVDVPLAVSSLAKLSEDPE